VRRWRAQRIHNLHAENPAEAPLDPTPVSDVAQAGDDFLWANCRVPPACRSAEAVARDGKSPPVTPMRCSPNGSRLMQDARKLESPVVRKTESTTRKLTTLLCTHSQRTSWPSTTPCHLSAPISRLPPVSAMCTACISPGMSGCILNCWGSIRNT
jgi:hypothetical protein